MTSDGAAARTRLYLIRHCDVFNPEGVLYGYLPGYRLSERGIRQAHSLGRRLAEQPVRRIYVSPLQRAMETAEIIATYLPGVELVPTDDLIEAQFGRYLEGVKPRDVMWRRPLWLVHMARPGLMKRDETVAAMAARVQAPIDRILDDFPGEAGICVSHGDPIQAFWVKADGRRDLALHRLQCMKGGMLVLDYEGGRLAAKTYVPPEEVPEAELPEAPLPTRTPSSSSATSAPAVSPASPGG